MGGISRWRICRETRVGEVEDFRKEFRAGSTEDLASDSGKPETIHNARAD